ncbi:DUF185-domain-containing protein [Delitschia confertaspora ATCC 74209]|uniref:Protein arginine methyltransferase NDUFAF7 n=1 Tax=Delitschia confertaspora ATCC 74209 TaxID=1513339 RepID=A0A9P4JQ97_9PLEO|nr:DUF185-domain-containing protein [Delitschia confertaspora ATCC 74209]
MRHCLTAPEGGYYTKVTAGRDPFGAKGDFITSPEISQVFGELVGIWIIAEWMAQGRSKEGVQIIEVGPGRGTLMADVLRSIRNFKAMASSIESIYMVEASPHLREAQRTLLCGDSEMKEIDIGYKSRCKYVDVDITWCEDIRFVPKGPSKTPFIIAHEFFDALPIHVFQNIPDSSIPKSSQTTILTPTGPITPKPRIPPSPQNKWHELVVSPISNTSSSSSVSSKSSADPPPEFQLTVSKTPTPHSLYLPSTSPRYAALSNTPNAIIEISPESLTYISDIATRIGGTNPSPNSSTDKPSPSGAALILDYGTKDTIPANTLRGIRQHKLISPFSVPGEVDISADVDFMALAESAINASPGVEVHGPIEQATFLNAMGIEQRAEMLLKKAKASEGGEETVKRIESGWKRLVDRGPTGMGKIYKAMAIVPYDPKRQTPRRPVGFGGDVVV